MTKRRVTLVCLLVAASACGGLLEAAPNAAGDGGADSGADATTPIDVRPGEAVVVTGVRDPVKAMVSDGTSLFLIDAVGRLATVPVTGGALQILYENVDLLAGVDDANVYFFSQEGDSPGMFIAAKTGGPWVPLGERTQNVAGTAFVRGTVYWLQGDTTQVPPITLWSSSQRGSQRDVELVAGWSLPGFLAIAVTDDTVFLGPRDVARFTLDGGFADAALLPVRTDAGESLWCARLLADDRLAYCVQRGTAPLLAITNDGTVTSVLPQVDSVTAFAQDTQYLYWATAPDGGTATLQRAPKRGGAQSLVTVSGAYALCTDDHALYWDFDGTIKRIAR